MNIKKLVIGAALTGLTIVGTSGCSSTPEKKMIGECHGVNACKGKGDCGGKSHACAGKNSCKGKGWTKMAKSDCLDKSGDFVSDEDSDV